MKTLLCILSKWVIRKQGCLMCSHCLLQWPHGSSAETHFYVVSVSAHGVESRRILYFNNCHIGKKKGSFSILNACLQTLNLIHTFYLVFVQSKICNLLKENVILYTPSFKPPWKVIQHQNYSYPTYISHHLKDIQARVLIWNVFSFVRLILVHSRYCSHLCFQSKASKWEWQAALHWRGREVEETAQKGLSRLQIPATKTQERKARLRFGKWGWRPFGGWDQPQPIPLQGSPPGCGP